jgi:hypothetical protein
VKNLEIQYQQLVVTLDSSYFPTLEKTRGIEAVTTRYSESSREKEGMPARCWRKEEQL